MNNENQPPSLPAVPDAREEEEAWEKPGTVAANTVQGQMYRSLRSANIARQAEWCPEQVPDLSFRGNELAGETGEVCNVIKKLERERQGWRGSRDTKEHLAEELADVVICADLIGIAAGIDLDAAVALKFNATSEKVGLPHRLAPSVGAETKSDAASEFSQIPFETGGRNALNLQRALEELDKQYHALLDEAFDTARKYKHKGDTHGDNFYRGKETGLIAFDIALTPLKKLIRDLGKNLQSAQAASDGKEQGPGQLMNQSGPPPCAMCGRPPHPDYYGHSYRPAADEIPPSPPLPDNGEAVQTKDLEE